MSRRGRGRGHGHGEPNVEGPTVDPETGLGQVPQVLIDLLAPLATQMGAIHALLAGVGVTPPQPSPEAPPAPEATIIPPVITPAVAVASAEQEVWLRLNELYQKLRAPEFSGGSDPLIADKWKEDVGNILDLMGVEHVER